MSFSGDNLWCFWDQLVTATLVLVALHSPGCRFTLCYHLYNVISFLCPWPVPLLWLCLGAAPIHLCSLADLTQAMLGLAAGWPHTLSAGPAGWRSALWSALSSKENFKVLPSFWSLHYGSRHSSSSYFSHLVLEGQATAFLGIWKDSSLPWQIFQHKRSFL